VATSGEMRMILVCRIAVLVEIAQFRKSGGGRFVWVPCAWSMLGAHAAETPSDAHEAI